MFKGTASFTSPCLYRVSKRFIQSKVGINKKKWEVNSWFMKRWNFQCEEILIRNKKLLKKNPNYFIKNDLKDNKI